jgi:restriction endonuclease S subunit
VLTVSGHKQKPKYVFTETLQTSKVAFYDYEPTDETKTLRVRVPIDAIVRNAYALNYNEYLVDERDSVSYEAGVVVKTLGEICAIQNGKRIVKSQVETGVYPVLGGGGVTSFYTDTYTREGKTCKISREGMSLHNCVMRLQENYYLNSQGFTIVSNDKNVIDSYLWYYVEHNKEAVYQCGRGSAQKAIDIVEFKSMRIPIPSLERQKAIVEYLDFIYEDANKSSTEKIAQLKKLNAYAVHNQQKYGDNEMKTLGEVCDIRQGSMLSKMAMVDGEYDVIGGGKIIGKHNTSNRAGKEFTLTRVGDPTINYIDTPYYLTDNGFSLKSVDTVLTKYVYHVLANNINTINQMYKGAAQKVISKTNVKTVKIAIPSLKRQKELVIYCDSNNKLIAKLEAEIAHNIAEAVKMVSCQNIE